MNIKKHLGLLGMKAEDRVTGFKGVISSMSFDLYGCVQGLLTPAASDVGKYGDSVWLDVARLKITSKKPVMDIPDFDLGRVAEGRKGPADKPPMR